MNFRDDQCLMIINNTGKIINDLYMVGPPAMPVYLLDGEKPAIFDASEYTPIQGPKQFEAAYLLNLEAKVKAIKRRLENRSENLSCRKKRI